MSTVTDLIRHPIKSHGRESIAEATLAAGQPMPFDRLWAVAHDASSVDGTTWVPCANFSRVSKAPALMAVTCQLDTQSCQMTLSHPEKEDLTFNPDEDNSAFIEWVLPLVPKDRALPDRLVKLADRGFTDSDFPSVTLCNHASHRAVEDRLGQSLSIHRWRGNIWFDSEDPWIEFDWMGKDVRIGECILSLRERTDRCLATTSNPETGKRDADTLAALQHWGHQDFSVRAYVKQGGTIRVGDRLEVI